MKFIRSVFRGFLRLMSWIISLISRGFRLVFRPIAYAAKKPSFWLWAITGFFLLVLGLLDLELAKHSSKIFGSDWLEWNWGWAAFFAQVLYILFSFRIVGPTEVGAKLFFGKPIQELSSGLTFAPLGIMSVTKETRLVIEEQYPDDPENVWKGDQNQMPAGKMPPIRVTHAQPAEPSDDPINRRMTTEVSIIVRYRIRGFIQFLTTIGSVKEARRQIRDIVVATVREELARKTPAQTLAEWGNINGILRAAIEKLVGVTASNGTSSWGVDVENVRMEEVDLGRTVNEGLRNVPRADLDKKVTVTTAEGESEKRRLEGIGSATALQVLLEAKSIGYAKIAEALKLDKGSLILQVETAREAMEKSKYSLVAGSAGMADIFNIVAAIQGILPRLKPEEEK